MKNNEKGRLILLWATLVACILELVFSIVLMFVAGTTKTIFIVLLAVSSVAILAFSLITIFADKKYSKSMDNKISEYNKEKMSEEQNVAQPEQKEE